MKKKQTFRHRGAIQSEVNAAKIYDKRAILAKGLHAKTNFNYSKNHLERILVDDDDLVEYELNKEMNYFHV